MIKSRLCLLSLVFVAITHAPALAAQPSKLPSPVIAVVDVQRIMQESLAAQSVQKQLDAQRIKFQTEIEGEENQLRDAEQSLTSQHDKVPAADYAEREQQLRARFSTVEIHVQARHKVLDQSFADSMGTVRTSLLAVIDKVAHERGANLVIFKQQTLWTDLPLDITDEVLARLDQQLPKVTVATPPPEPADLSLPAPTGTAVTPGKTAP